MLWNYNGCDILVEKVFRENGDLFGDVHEESIAGPPTHYLDGVVGNVVDVHCHGATCVDTV